MLMKDYSLLKLNMFCLVAGMNNCQMTGVTAKKDSD